MMTVSDELLDDIVMIKCTNTYEKMLKFALITFVQCSLSVSWEKDLKPNTCAELVFCSVSGMYG